MRITELLKERKMTKADLAKRLGWSQQRLYSRLKSPKLETLEMVSGAIGCEIHELFESSEDYAHWYDKGEWLGIRKK